MKIGQRGIKMVSSEAVTKQEREREGEREREKQNRTKHGKKNRRKPGQRTSTVQRKAKKKNNRSQTNASPKLQRLFRGFFIGLSGGALILSSEGLRGCTSRHGRMGTGHWIILRTLQRCWMLQAGE